MGTFVAFMRGINVGGKNKLPMKDLRAIFERLGADSVETYIQSGNVIFGAQTAPRARALGASVAEAVSDELGITSPVVIRSAAALRKIAIEHPLGDAEASPKAFAVGFLATKPSAAKVRSMEVDRFLPDRWQIQGDGIYLHFPNGAARSKLTNAYIDRTLGTISTVRNWSTLLKVVQIVDGRS